MAATRGRTGSTRRWRLSRPWPVLAALLATACAAPGPRPAEAEAAWQRHRAALESLVQWTARGRLAVETDGQSWNAGVTWDQEGERYRIMVSGPFGQGAARIEGGPEGVSLTTADGTVRRADGPEALLREAFGWWIPISGLRYWLLGRDAPQAGPVRTTVASGGRLDALEQSGWEIRYLRYDDALAPGLPARLDLERPDMSVRVVVSRWERAG